MMPYGVLHGVPTYETYKHTVHERPTLPTISPRPRGPTCRSRAGIPEEFLVRPRLETIPAWHLIGGKDPLDPSELTGHRARRRLSRAACATGSAATA